VDFGEAERTPIDLGLALLPGWPTPTPRPNVALDCQLIYDTNQENSYVRVTAIQPGLEGSVVLALDEQAGLRRYAADGTFLESLPAAPNLPTDRVLVGPDGRIWTWGCYVSDGLALFDGAQWRTVAPYDHPGDGEHRVYDAAIAADGALWLGTDLGALRLDEAAGQWTRHASYKPVGAVVPTPDGTIWLLKCDQMAQCTPTLLRLTPGGPRLYEESAVVSFERVLNNVDGASYDGSGIWVVNDFGLDRWDIATATWTPYTAETTNNAFPPTIYISQYALAPDGTLWLAAPRDGFVVNRLQFSERRFAFIRARPQSGEWQFAGNPLIDGQYIDSVVVAGDGSVWANLRYDYSVYRCE
jgi:ligand-binding sensor domain-containing protein